MSLMNRLKELVGDDEETHHYQCLDCASSFERDHDDVSRISCPDCGAKRIRSVTGPA